MSDDKEMSLSLSASRVFLGALNKLREVVGESAWEYLDFDRGVGAEVADDSDYHRRRKGSMVYTQGRLVEVDGQRWFLVLGTRTHGYPADLYGGDISAVQVPGEISAVASARDLTLVEFLKSYIRRQSTYFKNSLILFTYDGRMALHRGLDGSNPFSREMLNRVDVRRLQGFIVQEREIDPEHFFPDGRSVISRAVRYRPDLVDFLAKAIHETLRSVSLAS
jgi:hypothetical protein